MALSLFHPEATQTPWQHVHTGGRPAHVPDQNSRIMVQTLAAHGTPHRIIAAVLGVARDTLRRHYRVELSEGFELIKGKIQATVAVRALEGDLNAAKFWLLRWCPEWRVVKEDATAQSEADTAVRQQSLAEAENAEVVHFYLPPNGGDVPLEQAEAAVEPAGPIIDGEAA